MGAAVLLGDLMTIIPAEASVLTKRGRLSIAMELSELQRIQLAAFCYARSHLRVSPPVLPGTAETVLRPIPDTYSHRRSVLALNTAHGVSPHEHCTRRPLTVVKKNDADQPKFGMNAPRDLAYSRAASFVPEPNDLALAHAALRRLSAAGVRCTILAELLGGDGTSRIPHDGDPASSRVPTRSI